MSFIHNDEIFQGSVSESWNFRNENDTEYIQEDIAVMLKLVSNNGKIENTTEQVFMTLISLFASIDGLLPLFVERLDIFNLEVQKRISVEKYIFSSIYRNAFNAASIEHKEYVGQVAEIAKIVNEIEIAKSFDEMGFKKKESQYKITENSIIENKIKQQQSTKATAKQQQSTKATTKQQQSGKKEATEKAEKSKDTISTEIKQKEEMISKLVYDEGLKLKIIQEYERDLIVDAKNKTIEHFKELGIDQMFLNISGKRPRKTKKQSEEAVEINSELLDNEDKSILEFGNFNEGKQKEERKIEFEKEEEYKMQNNLNLESEISQDKNGINLLINNNFSIQEEIDRKRKELLEDGSYSDEEIEEELDQYRKDLLSSDKEERELDYNALEYDYYDDEAGEIR